MAIEVFNRHEIKYQVSDEQCCILRERFAPYMEADSYSRNGETYLISNIYYDTVNHELIRRSLDKPVYKEKLRLRSYGVKSLDDKVFLEVKKKYNGIVNKRRTKIYLKDAYRFIEQKTFTNEDGSTELPGFMNRQVMNELTYLLHQYENLRPVLYLSYERCAMFARDDSDIRVTFDHNIKTRRYDLGLHYGNYGDSLIPDDRWIMEVKVNQSMPLWLTEIMTENKIFPTSFSKYGTEYKLFMQSWCSEKKQEVPRCLNPLSDRQPLTEQFMLKHQ